MRFSKLILFSTCIFFMCSNSLIATSGAEKEQKILNIGVRSNSMPISGHVDGNFRGFSVSLWKKVVDDLGYSYKYSLINDDFLGLELVRLGVLDAIIGPYDINPVGFDLLDYSTPILINSVNMVVLNHPVSFSSIMNEVTTPLLKNTLLWTFLLFFIFTLFLWLMERKHHSLLKKTTLYNSVGNCLWVLVCAFVRDLVYTPATSSGRWLMSLWLMCSVVFMTILASSVTATIISIKTSKYSEFSSKADIEGLPVGAIENRSGQYVAEKYGARVMLSESFDELFEWLQEGKVKSIIGDKSILQYYIKSHPNLPVHMSSINFETELYAFVFRHGSLLTKEIDHVLLNMQADKSNEGICREFFSGSIEGCLL